MQRTLLVQLLGAAIRAFLRAQTVFSPEQFLGFRVGADQKLAPKEILEGADYKSMRPEGRGGVGEKGLESGRDFLAQKGTIVAPGDSRELLIERFSTAPSAFGFHINSPFLQPLEN